MRLLIYAAAAVAFVLVWETPARDWVWFIPVSALLMFWTGGRVKMNKIERANRQAFARTHPLTDRSQTSGPSKHEVQYWNWVHGVLVGITLLLSSRGLYVFLESGAPWPF